MQGGKQVCSRQKENRAAFVNASSVCQGYQGLPKAAGSGFSGILFQPCLVHFIILTLNACFQRAFSVKCPFTATTGRRWKIFDILKSFETFMKHVILWHQHHQTGQQDFPENFHRFSMSEKSYPKVSGACQGYCKVLNQCEPVKPYLTALVFSVSEGYSRRKAQGYRRYQG